MRQSGCRCGDGHAPYANHRTETQRCIALGKRVKYVISLCMLVRVVVRPFIPSLPMLAHSWICKNVPVQIHSNSYVGNKRRSKKYVP